MKLKNIILASILGTTALTSAAQESTKDYYAQFNVGASYGQKPKGDFSQGTLGTSPVYGFALGYKFHENFRADWSLDYRSGFENDYTNSENDLGQTDTMKFNTKVKSLVSMINFYYDIAEINGFTPYLTSGLGLSRNTTNNSAVTDYHTDAPTDYTSYSDKTKTDFAWKMGLGSKYSINKDFDLDLRYQYADLGKFRTGTTATINGEMETVNRKSGKIKSHEVLAGIAYKF